MNGVIKVIRKTRMIPCYTCLKLYLKLRSFFKFQTFNDLLLDHHVKAQRLNSVITSTAIIQRQSYKANKPIIRTIHQSKKKFENKHRGGGAKETTTERSNFYIV